MALAFTTVRAFGPLSLALGAALQLAGCGGSDGGTTTPAGAETVLRPLSLANCVPARMQATLASLTGNLATTITGAVVSPAGATANGAAVSDANPALPEHCVVSGTIDAHVGDPGGTPYGNNFRLRVPTAWNGRFFFQGGGGNNGTVGDALGALRDGDNALVRGFAVVAQDSGHAGSAPSFALDQKAYNNFAYQAVHDATTISKALLTAYFGSSPKRSYFVGCSNGGREAMVSAQRYDDFDGVVAGDPAMNMFDQWMQDIWNMRIMADLVGTPAGTAPVSTSAAYTDPQLAYVSNYFMAKCDALDGATDGLISNYAACTPAAADLQKLQCAAQGGSSTDANCLSAAQSTGLKKFYAGPTNSAGASLFPGFYPGVETAIRSGMLGSGATGLGSLYSSVLPNMYYMGYGFLGYPGAAANPRTTASYPTATAYAAQFNFDTEPAKLAPGRLLFHGDNVDPTKPGANYEAFKQRGGKLLIYTGTADASVQAPGVADFMDRLNRQYTATTASGFARAFFVPGMNHCSGGKTTDRFDALAPLVAWVEKGTPPEQIVAKANTTLDPNAVGITRPLCAYPKYAKYNGNGDVNSAANYTCSSN